MVINDLLGICGGVQLGELPEDSECGCLIAPPLSQICGVVILPNGAKSPLDWTNKSDIESTIDNTVNNNTRGKWLLGIGEIAEPQEIIAELGRTYIKYARRVYTLVHEVPICDQITYNFLLKLQTNWTGFNFWYYTVGGYMYGKNTGIRPGSLTVTFPKGRGEEDVEIGNLKITWYADGDPLRNYIPRFLEPISSSNAIPFYRSDYDALVDGVLPCGYYYLTLDNIYGFSEGIKVTAWDACETTYASDEDAPVAAGELYFLSIDNIYGMKLGTPKYKIGGALTTYASDADAALAGVQINQDYILDSSYYYSTPYGVIKKRIA